MSKSLEQLRGEIDGLDDQIIDLLNRRSALAVEIGKIKQARGEALYVTERERSILRRLIARNAGPLSHASVCRIFTQVIASARAVEHHHRIIAGGADAEWINRAVAFVAGGCVDLRMCATPAELIGSFPSEGDVMALVGGAWAIEVGSGLATRGLDVMWSGCTRIDDASGGGHRMFHVFTRRPDRTSMNGPVTLVCLTNHASESAEIQAALERLPVRSASAVPVLRGEGASVLVVHLDVDNPAAMQAAIELLSRHSRAVWSL